jgi:hypothetical protein
LSKRKAYRAEAPQAADDSRDTAAAADPHPAPLASGAPARVAGPLQPAAARPSEEARVQQYLDSLYTKKDVVSTFETKFSEQIDCIDFWAQPAVKLAVAQGHPPGPRSAQSVPGEAAPAAG